MIKPSFEYTECLHYKRCCYNDDFVGCATCHDYEYRRDDWFREQFSRLYEMNIPYNYIIIFDHTISSIRLVLDDTFDYSKRLRTYHHQCVKCKNTHCVQCGQDIENVMKCPIFVGVVEE